MRGGRLIDRNNLNIGVFTWRKFAWCGIFLCVCFLVAKPELYKFATWAMLPFVCILFFYDDFYALCGMFLFFEEQLVVISGVSLFALYSFAVLVKFFIFDKHEKKISVLHIPVILVLLLYAAFVMPHADIRAALSKYTLKGQIPPAEWIIILRLIIGYLLDIAFIYFLALRIRDDDSVLLKLFKVILASSILSGIYGYTAQNIFYYAGAESGIIRYMASFNDPNYASFFFNLSIFIALIANKSKKWKIPLLLVFYYFLIASGSLSGIIFNIAGLFLFSVLKYKEKAIVAVFLTAVIAGISTIAIMQVPVLKNLQIIKSLETRIHRQFQDETNLSDATSGREQQWENYWGYYKSQDIHKKLFGGNIVMSYSIEQKFMDEYKNPPHQAYLNFLLNFGIIGTVVVILCYGGKVALLFAQKDGRNRDTVLILIMLSFMWVFYGFGFDYFGDWRFMVFYFL
ncbi:MAG: O-antigen ligase family protein [Clostridia bacterium]|nr:O-antigen ligase family protein [Clostridia bacterium]